MLVVSRKGVDAPIIFQLFSRCDTALIINRYSGTTRLGQYRNTIELHGLALDEVRVITSLTLPNATFHCLAESIQDLPILPGEHLVFRSEPFRVLGEAVTGVICHSRSNRY